MSGLDALIVLARTLEALGAAVLFGAPLLLVWARTPPEVAASARPLVATAAAVLLAGSLLALAGQTANMAGSLREALAPGALAGVLAETGFGRSVVVRAVAALAAGAVALAGPTRLAALAGLGAIASASLAWSGHGAAQTGATGAVHLVSDVVHLLATGAWIGALAALLLLLHRAWRAPRKEAALAQALRRFSGVGTGVVALIVATGLVNAWALVTPAPLTSLPATEWGRKLLWKLALVAGMLALAAANRWVLTPRLDGEAPTTRTLRSLRASVGVEAGFGLAALLLAASMAGLPPPGAQA